MQVPFRHLMMDEKQKAMLTMAIDNYIIELGDDGGIPEPVAHIQCTSDKLGMVAHQPYVDLNPAAVRRVVRRGLFRGDLVTMSTIGLPTIRALGSLVSGKKDD